MNACTPPTIDEESQFQNLLLAEFAGCGSLAVMTFHPHGPYHALDIVDVACKTGQE